ncbi:MULTISPECIES: XRE family transcriptional regulator [Clostridia]|uniref:XRE family transcriptional regulator n=2 Tax=Blautia TaxID=572511 RepID=A0A8I0ADM4_9FIRM|nr:MULTISPECIES: XRE family transcriptional regulator [Clostridia]MBC5651836.1 XRE family transcriptional regulator [Blautia segnis]RGF71486.1 ImmA/IrrE family metallo-endopeptidase [Ruminococcus sp. AF31-8BH]
MNVQKFNGQRLKEALQFRGKKMTELADETGISKQSLSLYANAGNKPPFENVEKIARTLDFPVDFFTSEDLCTVSTGNTYFRSQASATKKSRNAQKIKLEYVSKMYEVILNYVNVPELNLPDTTGIDIPEDIINVDSEQAINEIEKLAMLIREFWDLGSGPIDNLQYALQSNGIIVTGFRNVDSDIDAFSQQIKIDGKTIYIIALAIGSKPIERLRFDMAHELGHILLHTWGEDNEEISRDEFNAREKQANMFASALLLPKKSFSKSVSAYPTNIDYYFALKKKWKVSMQAMMYRARQLDIISANQFQYMMRIMSKNGYRLHEPGDKPGEIGDTIFQAALDMLFEGGYLTVSELLREFGRYGIYLSQHDLENLMYLREGTLYQESKVIPFMTIKKDTE